MKMFNATGYDTVALRRIVVAVHNSWARGEGYRLKTWGALRVDVVNSRGDCTGFACFHGRNARLRVPKTGLTAWAFAQIAWHEMGHLYGYRHAAYSTWAKQKTIAEILADASAGAFGDPIPRKQELLSRPKATPE